MGKNEYNKGKLKNHINILPCCLLVWILNTFLLTHIFNAVVIKSVHRFIKDKHGVFHYCLRQTQALTIAEGILAGALFAIGVLSYKSVIG